jgi:diguanylate cyclase (GGDEF)-like protein
MPQSLPLPIALPRSTEALLSRVMAVVLLIGIGAPPVLWWIETRSGVILPWDRVLLPLMSAGFGTCWLALRSGWLRPERVGLAALLLLQGYLVGSLLAMMLWHPELSRTYQIVSVLFWVPVGFAAAYVFLPQRMATVFCIAVHAAAFVPLGAALAAGSAAAALWPADTAPLLGSLAMSLATFIVLLGAVSHLKSRAVSAELGIQAMEQLATTDGLTGLANRRAMAGEIDAALALAHRSGQPVSLAIIDFDHFKRINDRHGHAAGDAVLTMAAQRLRGHLRAADRLGRWGGEEFVLLAPATPAAACVDLCERLRRDIAAASFAHGDPVTVSAGVAALAPGDDAAHWLARADEALYAAKDGGRNRVELRLRPPLATAP